MQVKQLRSFCDWRLKSGGDVLESLSINSFLHIRLKQIQGVSVVSENGKLHFHVAEKQQLEFQFVIE